MKVLSLLLKMSLQGNHCNLRPGDQVGQAQESLKGAKDRWAFQKMWKGLNPVHQPTEFHVEVPLLSLKKNRSSQGEGLIRGRQVLIVEVRRGIARSDTKRGLPLMVIIILTKLNRYLSTWFIRSHFLLRFQKKEVHLPKDVAKVRKSLRKRKKTLKRGPTIKGTVQGIQILNKEDRDDQVENWISLVIGLSGFNYKLG